MVERGDMLYYTVESGSPKRATSGNSMVPLVLSPDPHSATPLHRQLYDEIRAAVLGGRLAAGARMPSTRALAADLQLSRNTVAAAFDQLLAEGYLAARRGAGTFVARVLPDDLLRVP